MRSAPLIALGLVACGQSGVAALGRARVVFTGKPDTARFEVPVVAQTCAGGAGVLVHGEQRGDGLLVWLRGGVPPDTGTYVLLTRGDTVTTRGAMVTMRFMVGDVAHGFALDDGAATVVRVVPALELHVSGRGLEMSPPGQRSAEVDFLHVSIDPDTISCRVRP